MKSVKRYDGKIEHCDNGGYVTFADYKKLEARLENAEGRERKLEARVKGLEAQNVNLNEGWLKAVGQRDAAEAELSRLMMQEDIGVVNYKNELQLYARVIEEGMLKAGDKIYAEPRPAVLPPEATLKDAPLPDQNNWEGAAFVNGANWMRQQVVSLGCQPQRFVVKRPGTKCIGWVKETIHEHDEQWLAAIKASGGEIAE